MSEREVLMYNIIVMKAVPFWVNVPHWCAGQTWKKKEWNKKERRKERKKERKNAFLDLPGHLQQVCTRDNP